MDKNKPRELLDLHEAYLDEVEVHINEKWANREKSLIDLKLQKEWYPKNWKTRTTESVAAGIIKVFKKKGWLNGDSHHFAQILAEEVNIRHISPKI